MLRLGLAALLAATSRIVANPPSGVYRDQSGRRISAGDRRPHRNVGYTGAALRAIRARNGVGRPPYAKRRQRADRDFDPRRDL